jgi:Zn-dependent peptidase ImmA (M78 family)
LSQRAQRLARRLIEKYGIEYPPVPVEQIAKREGLQVSFHDLEDHVSGMLIRQRDGDAVLAVNVHHHSNRQRFSISHELAHYLMHQDQPTIFVDDTMVHFRADARRENRRFDPRELEANVFAAALLMPKRFLREDLAGRPIDASDEDAVRRLATRYQVSSQALTIRLIDLGFVLG